MSLRRTGSGSGFTLIELMITVALSSLVAVLIYTVFIEQTKAYRVQADMGSMQQNLRVAMELLTRDIGTAGWGVGFDGGAWGNEGQDSNSGTATYALRIRDDHQDGRDSVELFMLDANRDHWAYTDSAIPHECSTSQIRFASEDIAQAGLYSADGEYNRIACYSAVGAMGRPQSFVWEVVGTGDAATGLVDVNTATEGDFLEQCRNNLPKMMICAPPMWVAYYIDSSTSNGIGIGSAAMPVLYLASNLYRTAGAYPHEDDIPVALGIEDLQLQVCESGTGVDCDSPSSWLSGYNLDTSNPPYSSWADLTAVRIHITARTVRPDATRASVSTPVDIDPDDLYFPSTISDSYHRRVARTEVVIRNATGVWQQLNQPY